MISFFPSFLSAKKKRTISVKFLDSSQTKQILIQYDVYFDRYKCSFLIKIIKLNLLVMKVKYLFSFFLIHLKNL